ncbi:MAG TPA: tetratricopeptide repeat protein [Thermoanaerobaculia bacterium]|nr:tetratricopeptide repeat protein [Thermoanaerobaculia bacterium]
MSEAPRSNGKTRALSTRLAGLCLALLAIGAAAPRIDPLASRGIAVTGGAAPGYLEDRVCAECHREIWTTYQQVGMARSFARPGSAGKIEDFARGAFAHAASKQNFEMTWRGDRLFFRREQLDAAGQPINVWEHEVDWILGSGNHARTYLYRTEGGELYQLPIAWYTQEAKWGMAPGFDRPDHEGVLRRVRRECMFCHNAYPDAPQGSDLHDAPQIYPEKLPEGIGCQRCHGPGAEHVRRALTAPKAGAAIRAAIVDPGALSKPRMEDVCFECHFQPSVALQGLRRYGVGDWSFRPGQNLAEYQVAVDVEEEGVAPGDRFEINHQAYRLRQSRCYLKSADLSCLTCHDPHVKVPAAERAAHYASACLGCHEGHKPEACGIGGATAPAGSDRTIDPKDCVSCHMPKRRPSDVVHAVMTDHKIQIPKAGVDFLAPRGETDPVITGLRLLEPEKLPGASAEIYRAATAVRAVRSTSALDRLEALLATAKLAEIEPYLDLAEGQLGARRFGAAEKTLRGILSRSPGRPLALEWLGIALAGQGKNDEAITTLRAVLAAGEKKGSPARPESLFNLGLLRVERDPQKALADLDRALALRGNQVAAWFYRGVALARLDRRTEAEAAYRKALEIDPRFTRGYLALAESFIARGEKTEARRWLVHGAEIAADPAKVRAALDAMP